MWEFYLVGCEIAFRRMNQMVFQIQLAHRQEAVPLTRDYMFEFERAQRERAPAAAAAAAE
jgi:cyclopropane-fatty-acyl-phospholipid synthase